MADKFKPALRLVLYMPHAHWRVPFAYQRRHTLALPPFSTVIGLLCNLLGIRNLNGSGAPCQCQHCSEIYKFNTSVESDESSDSNTTPVPEDSLDAILYHEMVHNLQMAVMGTFKSKTSEYTWFRNLIKKSHVERFGHIENRMVDNTCEHPGGQSPVTIDILNDVYLIIYLAHRLNCRLFLHLLQYAFLNGGDFSLINDDNKNLNDLLCSGIHVWNREAGRWCHDCKEKADRNTAEHDLLCSQESECSLCDYIRQDDTTPNTLSSLRQRHRLAPLHLGRAEDWFRIEDVQIVGLEPRNWKGQLNVFLWISKDRVKQKVPGLFYRVPSFYSIQSNRRLFHYVPSYLSDGKISNKFWINFVDPLADNFINNILSQAFDEFTVSHLKSSKSYLPVALAPMTTFVSNQNETTNA